MEDEATQTGADQGNQGSTGDDNNQTPPVSPRELAMEAIQVRREIEEDQAQTPQDQQIQAQLEGSTLQALMWNDKRPVTLKIDGVESQVTVEELARNYQKASAADRRLEEATRILNEARATAAQSHPPLGIEENTQSAQSTPADPKGTEEDIKQAKALVGAMFDGDEDEASKKLVEFMQGRQTPTPDLNQLTAQLVPVLKQQLVVESALEQFENDFADVMADPYLENMTADFIAAEMKDGKTFVESLNVAGQKTRDWLASKGVVPPQAQPTMNRNAKLERKAGIDQIQSLNRKATTVEEPVQTASDVIQEMRKARGLTV